MNIFEEARSIKGMMEIMGISQNEMAKRLGVSQSYVANKIRLLQLGEDLEKLILSAGLTERHARAVLKLRGDESRLAAINRISENNLTVAETEAMCDLLRDKEAPQKISSPTRVSAIAGFKDTLKQSVETLRSLGIEISRTDGSYGSKTYITLCIEE